MKNYESDHASEILSNLNKERSSEENFCDITLQAGSRDFPAHRCVLASVSSFFKKLLTIEMKEKYEEKVKLQHVDEKTLDAILDFIYTCRVSISIENIYKVLEAANFIDITRLKEYCADFLCDEVDHQNCFRILEYAQMYNMEALLRKINDVIKEEFEFIIKEEQFKELEFEKVLKIMEIKDKKISSQESVYYALVDWIKHDVTSREKFLPDLFKLIELEKLSGEFLANVVGKESLVTNSNECTKTAFIITTSRLEKAESDQKSLVLRITEATELLADLSPQNLKKMRIVEQLVCMDMSEDLAKAAVQSVESLDIDECFLLGLENEFEEAKVEQLCQQFDEEVVSCRKVGMEDGRILDSQITASSSYASWYEPKYGRLNEQSTNIRGLAVSGYWAPRSPEAGEYIQIALEAPARISGVITQGSPACDEFTTSYTIGYGNSTSSMKTIKDTSGNEKIFNANTDGNSEVTNMFPQPVTTNYIRLIVQKWHNHPAIRMELLTC